MSYLFGTKKPPGKLVTKQGTQQTTVTKTQTGGSQVTKVTKQTTSSTTQGAGGTSYGPVTEQQKVVVQPGVPGSVTTVVTEASAIPGGQQMTTTTVTKSEEPGVTKQTFTKVTKTSSSQPVQQTTEVTRVVQPGGQQVITETQHVTQQQQQIVTQQQQQQPAGGQVSHVITTTTTQSSGQPVQQQQVITEQQQQLLIQQQQQQQQMIQQQQQVNQQEQHVIQVDTQQQQVETQPQEGQDKLIFYGEYTKAMEQDWHGGHFCCFKCDKSLTGHRYILRDEHPYCIQCYEDNFANTCEECKKPIGCDSKDLSYKERHWHEVCFKCCDCQCSLVDKHFASKEEKLYCPDCHDNNFAPRCDGCGDIFKAGMKKYEYKNKQWHEQCFCCLVCKQPIGSKSFIPKDNDVVCIPCYEEQFAQRCQKCTQVINKGGVTYKGNPFHRECFTCTNCNLELAGQKFTSKDEAPYCAECYGNLFAKKCCKCTMPITGIGSTKFISFEERHWHSDCFQCVKCEASLVGRGFLTDGLDILCPSCGRS